MFRCHAGFSVQARRELSEHHSRKSLLIDFIPGGFLMPFTGFRRARSFICARCGPEFIRDAFTKYKITYMAVVPLILKNLQRGLREKFAALPPAKRKMLGALIAMESGALTRHCSKPRPGLSRVLLKDIHNAFGGGLEALLVGGAFTEPATIEFFHDIGIMQFTTVMVARRPARRSR